ncbi:hypothetical protein WN55_09036 [Dufourea novaeangliae]|uniref:Coiled-coil domain-containing protein 112 n=1 Tax=Dufourea novaeangliae TaxID=178035 RepID=A0A154P7Z5_DUFNO|nr:hypothetical protein WN55_09036 [Dufourea novaeangliae]
MVERIGASRSRVSSAERDLYLKPLLKLKQQEDIIERGLATAIENMKIEPNFLQDIVQDYRDLSCKRQTFLKGIYKNMEDIASDLEFAKYATQNPEEIKKLDVNTYKLKLFKLSQKMQDLKKSCSIRDTLAQEQTLLDSELRDFEPQLQKCEMLRKDALISSQTRVDNRKENQDYKDAQDFHALVAKTGHMENWTLEDHLFFLKMRKKCENVPALVAAIQRKCPDLSVETIVNHEAWYKLYQTLREKQRIAVEEWRKKKELNKLKSTEETDETITNDIVEEDTPAEDGEDNNVVISKTSKIFKTAATRSSNSAESNKSEKKELIKKWRMEKENKDKMDEEQLKIRMKLKREIEENQRRKRKEKVQQALEQYKQKKALECASRGSSAHSKEKCTYDCTLIKAFRRQDTEYTKRRKERILRSQRSNKIEMPTTKVSDCLKIRDFSTLLNSTTVWREKCKAENATKHCNELQYINDIPKM